jgi:hypothetical protein
LQVPENNGGNPRWGPNFNRLLEKPSAFIDGWLYGTCYYRGGRLSLIIADPDFACKFSTSSGFDL